MAKNRAEWASGHRQLTRIGLSDGCGGELIPVAVQSGYHRNKFEGHLGNVGSKHSPSLSCDSLWVWKLDFPVLRICAAGAVFWPGVRDLCGGLVGWAQNSPYRGCALIAAISGAMPIVKPPFYVPLPDRVSGTGGSAKFFTNFARIVFLEKVDARADVGCGEHPYYWPLCSALPIRTSSISTRWSSRSSLAHPIRA